MGTTKAGSRHLALDSVFLLSRGNPVTRSMKEREMKKVKAVEEPPSTANILRQV
jgi:hypothetical protein